MAPAASNADRKAALDAASWLFNVVTSVGIIMVNKALMATHGFTFEYLPPAAIEIHEFVRVRTEATTSVPKVLCELASSWEQIV